MCCDPIYSDEETVGECPECGCGIDADGVTTEECCSYSPVECECCGWRPCDGSC
jgi:hypothetical protein